MGLQSFQKKLPEEIEPIHLKNKLLKNKQSTQTMISIINMKQEKIKKNIGNNRQQNKHNNKHKAKNKQIIQTKNNRLLCKQKSNHNMKKMFKKHKQIMKLRHNRLLNKRSLIKQDKRKFNKSKLKWRSNKLQQMQMKHY